MIKKILALLFLFLIFFLAFKFLEQRKNIRSNALIQKEEIKVAPKDSLKEKEKEIDSFSSQKEAVEIQKIDSVENKTTDKIVKKKEKKLPVVSKEKRVLNPGKVVEKEGLDKKILIYQNFKYPTKQGEYVSEVYDLKVKNPGFISLSAYTLDMSDNIRLYYRYNDGKNWSNWIELPKDTHIINHKRNVFGLATLNDNIEKIQFKSPVSPRSQVVFNFFIPKK